MANLTITIDDRILRRARARALEGGTSVNAIVSEYLTHYAGADASAQAIAEFLNLATSAGARSGGAGRTWSREELHERADVR